MYSIHSILTYIFLTKVYPTKQIYQFTIINYKYPTKFNIYLPTFNSFIYGRRLNLCKYFISFSPLLFQEESFEGRLHDDVFLRQDSYENTAHLAPRSEVMRVEARPDVRLEARSETRKSSSDNSFKQV